MKAYLVNKLCLIVFISSSLAWGDSSCEETKSVLHREFVGLDFDKDRSTVGADQAEPVKNKIQSFIKAHPELNVTDIQITASAAKIPFYVEQRGRKVLDPNSDERNFSLSQERAIFVEKALTELKKSSDFKQVKTEVKAVLAGPDFAPIDLNDRFVSNLTPGYKDKIKDQFEKNKKIYAEEALVEKSDDLLNEKQFGNLYQAKFKPFFGFKLVLSGHRKNDPKCLGKSVPADSASSGSKQ